MTLHWPPTTYLYLTFQSVFLPRSLLTEKDTFSNSILTGGFLGTLLRSFNSNVSVSLSMADWCVWLVSAVFSGRLQMRTLPTGVPCLSVCLSIYLSVRPPALKDAETVSLLTAHCQGCCYTLTLDWIRNDSFQMAEAFQIRLNDRKSIPNRPYSPPHRRTLCVDVRSKFPTDRFRLCLMCIFGARLLSTWELQCYLYYTMNTNQANEIIFNRLFLLLLYSIAFV